ncbi:MULTISPECIES: ABC transporter substrate-binding protein [Fusobacterium]|jgi:iron(III) transport system substrate-binding protein|uniref:ABC transporter substrate-binding protein n=1 Tax=Fusobacterium hominis TaxID=2764326 RepID=A0A7G9GZ34_9FUSO|nr:MULTISPECIES: ABC transporter substrate-binding protein [Fusobacterium]QNM16066.1 ABC transporter substrate-binding protein [Fusobacterium hominis]
MKKIILTTLLACVTLTTQVLAKNLKVVAAYGNKEKIFQEFTKETGIKVDFLDLSSGEVLSRIQAENGKPSADVWFGGGIDSFIAAKNKGLLEKYESKENIEFISLEYRDKDGYWSGISIVPVGFMVNNELLKEKKLPAPKVWEDLANTQYKDEIMMANPAISGTNYAMVDGLIQGMGEEKAWQYFKGLNENIPFFAKRGGEPPKKVASGEFAVAVIPMSGEFIAMEEKYPITTIYPEDMIPWVPAGMAIFKNAENLDEAKAFVDWALSKKGQEFIKSQDPRMMVRSDIEIPKSVKNINKDKLIKLNIDTLGADREKVLKKWNDQFGNKAQ